MADEPAPVTQASCFRPLRVPDREPPPDEQRLADVIHRAHLAYGECDPYALARGILEDGWTHPDLRPSASGE